MEGETREKSVSRPLGLGTSIGRERDGWRVRRDWMSGEERTVEDVAICGTWEREPRELESRTRKERGGRAADPFRRNERPRFNVHDSGIYELLDKLDLHLRGEYRLLVLEAISRSDFDDLDLVVGATACHSRERAVERRKDGTRMGGGQEMPAQKNRTSGEHGDCVAVFNVILLELVGFVVGERSRRGSPGGPKG